MACATGRHAVHEREVREEEEEEGLSRRVSERCSRGPGRRRLLADDPGMVEPGTGCYGSQVGSACKNTMTACRALHSGTLELQDGNGSGSVCDTIRLIRNRGRNRPLEERGEGAGRVCGTR